MKQLVTHDGLQQRSTSHLHGILLLQRHAGVAVLLQALLHIRLKCLQVAGFGAVEEGARQRARARAIATLEAQRHWPVCSLLRLHGRDRCTLDALPSIRDRRCTRPGLWVKSSKLELDFETCSFHIVKLRLVSRSATVCCSRLTCKALPTDSGCRSAWSTLEQLIITSVKDPHHCQGTCTPSRSRFVNHEGVDQ